MLEAVIKAITPRIMTWSQYAEAAWFMYQKKVMKNPAYKRYMPDYTKCMEHFALHAGEPVICAACTNLLCPRHVHVCWDLQTGGAVGAVCICNVRVLSVVTYW
jgi:hypothetical protein